MYHTTVGIGKRNGDGDNNDTGSEISLLPLNDKGINSEGLFLNLVWPRSGGTITEKTMERQARVIQNEAGNATVPGYKRQPNVDNNDGTD